MADEETKENEGELRVLKTSAVKNILIRYAKAHEEVFGEPPEAKNIWFFSYPSRENSLATFGIYALVDGKLVSGTLLREVVANASRVDVADVSLGCFKDGKLLLKIMKPKEPSPT